MQFDEVVRRRRMTRNFDPEALDPAVVDRLLTTALRAPAAGNTQGRDFVVLEGPTQTARYWQATTDEAWRRRSARYPGLSRAPVILLAYVDPAAYAARYDEPDKATGTGPSQWPVPYWTVDGAFAVLSLLLGAVDAGLGAAFLGNFRGEEALGRALGVPDGRRWLGAVLLGKAGAPDPPTRSARRERRTIDQCVHRGVW
ncbi:MAG: nitroreductase family protein [Acidimicrobiales bacterium]|nr:nitroreductase family protein [Acidimicrobiales bacterium]